MRKQKNKQLYLRVTQEQFLWVEQVSASMGLSKNDLVGLILDKAIKADFVVLVDKSSPVSS